MSYFRDQRDKVSFAWGRERGLRQAQVGAVWALSSHFTVSNAPAQAVLPTGSGKTAVMTLLPFVIPTDRVLVVAPSKLVRDQIAQEFRTLRVLRDTGTFPRREDAPRVAVVRHRITSRDDWMALAENDVVVGTPACLSSGYEGIPPPPLELFDLVIVDEAHHAAAKTWSDLLRGLSGIRAALFTATPFRRDEKLLPGTPVYSYPLGKAISDGIYAPIHFVPVSLVDDEDPDLKLAMVAAERLDNPQHQAQGSRVLVRTDRIAEAERLQALYETVGVALGVVHSGHSLRHVRRTIASLEQGDIRGIISVGVLGEGFDLPALKIAVYHKRHRSLPATLQFVGRIARANADVPLRAELLAVREDVEDETRSLYNSDAAWTTLIPLLAEAAIEVEAERRRYLETFEVQATSAFSDYSVQPQKMAEIYEVPADTDVHLDCLFERISDGHVIYRAVDEENELLALVTAHRSRPRWMSSDALDERSYQLHTVVLDKVTDQPGHLYLSTSSTATASAILSAIGLDHPRRVSPSGINRILWGMNLLSYSSVGMRNSRVRSAGRASYRTLAGSAVQNAVRSTEARGHVVGHLIGRRQVGDEITGVGVSAAKAKVWESETCGLLDYKRWCRSLGVYLRGGEGMRATAPLLALFMPRELIRFPEIPVAAMLPPELIQGTVRIRKGEQWLSLQSADLVLTRENDTTCRMRFLSDGLLLWECELDVSGDVRANSDWAARLGNSNDLVSFLDLLRETPPTLFFGDGSSTYRATLNVSSVEFPPFDPAAREILPWDGVDVRSEARVPRAGMQNIQAYLTSVTEREHPLSLMILDDRSGELADLVEIRNDGETVFVTLIHCKWSSEDAPGHRVADLHEGIGQCIRSARWALPELLWPELYRRLSTRQATTVVRGEPGEVLNLFRQYAEHPPATQIAIKLAQPGLRIADVERSANCNSLLVNALEWISDQNATFSVVGSA